MTKSVASDPEAYVLAYRALVGCLEVEQEKTAKAKLQARAETMKVAWQKWQGEDSLHVMAYGETM